MFLIIEIMVYYFDELLEVGKDNVWVWYCEGVFDYDWYGVVYEDFQCIVEIFGICFWIWVFWLMGGGISESFCIWFIGFWL